MHTTLEERRPQPSPPPTRRLRCELVVPLRWESATPDDEADLAAYLHQVARWCDVTVVDASPGPQAAARRATWPSEVRVLQPDSRWAGANGKVTGAMTGMAASRHPLVVICDDDVRYGTPSCRSAVPRPPAPGRRALRASPAPSPCPRVRLGHRDSSMTRPSEEGPR